MIVQLLVFTEEQMENPCVPMCLDILCRRPPLHSDNHTSWTMSPFSLIHRMFVSSLLLLWCTCMAEELTSSSRVYILYHAFRMEDDAFTPRGSITLTPSSEGGITVQAADGESMSRQTIQEFDLLSRKGGLYRIKIVDAENPTHTIIVSTLACDVQRANFREEISLLLSHTGSVVSASYRPLVSKLAPPCSALSSLADSSDISIQFKTTFVYSSAKPAMTIPLVLPHMRPPPGLRWFTRPSEGAGGSSPPAPSSEGASPFVDPAEEAKNQQNEQKGFFQRYWYLIVPLSVMLLTSSGGDDGRGKAVTGPPTAAGASSSTSIPTKEVGTSGSGDSLKHRRGKQQK